MNKYIKSATAHAVELKQPIYRGIRNLDQKAVFECLSKALDRAEGAARKKRILDTARYIKNNWGGIEAQIKHPEVGCSAEGHVSHILAARMSSRPMAWSIDGGDHMAQMRAIRANGEAVKEHYKARQEKAPVIVELQEAVKKELNRLKNKRLSGKEDLHNVPLLNGPNNLTRTALKGLNDQIAI